MYMYQSEFLPMLAVVRSMGFELQRAVDKQRVLKSLRVGNLLLAWRAKYGDADVVLLIYQYRYSMPAGSGDIQGHARS